jgi:hypothetical protein
MSHIAKHLVIAWTDDLDWDQSSAGMRFALVVVPQLVAARPQRPRAARTAAAVKAFADRFKRNFRRRAA